MAKEIERKFRVTGDGWRAHVTQSSLIRQGYLGVTPRASIRVRIREGKGAQLTVKSGGHALERNEYEYDIPVPDAEDMLQLCTGTIIEKRRHLVPLGDITWEVDVFSGAHDGLILAEVELPETAHHIDLPDWLGPEVTGDPQFYNSTLSGTGGEA